jgi:peroxiredoxin
MSNQSGTGVGPKAKKAVVFVLLAAGAGLLLIFLFSKGGPQRTAVIGEGDRAPEFTLSSLDGKQVSLSDHRGKVVMVHFWATWCPPCVEEMPTLEKLYRGAAGKDIVMLAVSVDEGGAAAVGSFMERNKLSLPVLLDPGHSVSRLYGTFKFPETYIIDRNGVVKSKVIGSRDWSNPAVIKVLQDITAMK